MDSFAHFVSALNAAFQTGLTALQARLPTLPNDGSATARAVLIEPLAIPHPNRFETSLRMRSELAKLVALRLRTSLDHYLNGVSAFRQDGPVQVELHQVLRGSVRELRLVRRIRFDLRV